MLQRTKICGLLVAITFAYGLATRSDDEASIPNDRSSLETFDQLSSLLQEDDAAVQKVCVDFGAFFRKALRVPKTRCGSQYPYCYENKCYWSSISYSNNNKFCSLSSTENHCSKCNAHHVLSITRSIALVVVENHFGSLAPCCHCNNAAEFLRNLNSIEGIISKFPIDLLDKQIAEQIRNVAMRDLSAVKTCVRKKVGKKCSTNEEDALVKEDAAAAAGRRTEQLDDASVEESDAELNDAMTVFRRMDEFLDWGGGATC